MKPSPGGRLPQAMFQSPPVHASTPSKIPLGHFPGLGRGDGRPFRPGWQVHLGQAFSPGQPSTTASWVQAMPGSQISPSLPSSPPTLLLQPPRGEGTWLPHPESRARSPVAVRRHPGWHPGLTPDASPPRKTPSSAPTHGLPPGLPPALQQENAAHQKSSLIVKCMDQPHHPSRPTMRGASSGGPSLGWVRAAPCKRVLTVGMRVGASRARVWSYLAQRGLTSWREDAIPFTQGPPRCREHLQIPEGAC